ncbi:MAG: tyrosine-type recombinase/integrase [Peptoniphilaceae bacterium]|nr:tyrosine-type recombinase/integrase [Peptoniphilaceae bacterium]
MSIPGMPQRLHLRRLSKKTGVWRRGGHNHLKKLELLTPPLHCPLYDFRHTFATRSAESGMNPTVLKNILGHADISTTLRYYVDITDKMMEQAVELMEKSV